MSDRSPVRAIVVLLLVLAGAAAIGAAAYNAGMAHGVAEASRTVALPLEGTPQIYVWPGPGPWHGGYFPLVPLGVLVLAFVVVRGVLWGGPWRRGGCGYRDRGGVPPAFEEWHRRAHERQAPAPAAPAPDRTA